MLCDRQTPRIYLRGMAIWHVLKSCTQVICNPWKKEKTVIKGTQFLFKHWKICWGSQDNRIMHERTTKIKRTAERDVHGLKAIGRCNTFGSPDFARLSTMQIAQWTCLDLIFVFARNVWFAFLSHAIQGDKLQQRLHAYLDDDRSKSMLSSVIYQV